MNLLAVSCSHHRAQLAVRERLAFPNPDVLAQAYQRLKQFAPDLEVVVLSTCNRVELYAAQPSGPSRPTTAQLAQFLAEFHHVPLDEFVGELDEVVGPAAVRHLFEVVASLDSMVLGEPQIVSQVKDAYRIAEENQACGPLTHALFQRAIRTSARVRSETRLAEGRVSIASVAVGDFAKSIFDHFGDKLVLVIGAGDMAEETLRYLKDEGVRDVVVVNRSPERAQRLAETWGGIAAPWTELHAWLARADVVINATSADQPFIDAHGFAELRKDHRDRPVFLLDLGAPRGFPPSLGALDNVFLYDIDSLQRTCEENHRARRREVDKARQIIEDETAAFLGDFHRRASGDIVAQLRDGWHDVAQQELDKLFRKLPHLQPADRDAMERAVERIVNKLLHPPLEALRDESREGSPQGLLTALKRLFGLE